LIVCPSFEKIPAPPPGGVRVDHSKNGRFCFRARPLLMMGSRTECKK
jgi:hypothetical protein